MEQTGEELNNANHQSRNTTAHSNSRMNLEMEKFLAIFPEMVSSGVNNSIYARTPDIASRVKRIMEYNTAGSNNARGLMTVRAYQLLEDPDKITEYSLRLARILGWCVELTSLLLLDDMADNTTLRRGSVCWYRLPDVGHHTVIIDSLLFLTVVFDILKENFSDRPLYPEILHTFFESLRHLCIGQYEPPPKDYSRFTIEYFKAYSNYRTTYYTFKLPIYSSLLLANKPDKNIFVDVEDILVDIALLLAMQNDFSDCFGDESEIGKNGTDIQEGKCTWLAVTALQRCSAAQRAEFEACYGSADAAHVQRIKQLYEELQLPSVYRDAERAACDSIIARVNKLPADNKIPPALLLDLFKILQERRVY